jgi:glucose uptake protein GlcU
MLVSKGKAVTGLQVILQQAIALVICNLIIHEPL